MMLVSLAQLKQYLGLTVYTADALLTTMIKGYSQALETYCSRRFSSATYQELRSGNGKSSLMLRNYPVTAVASVASGVQAIPGPVALPDLQSQGFYTQDVNVGDNRLLGLRGYAFGRGPANVLVTYTAGYPVGTTGDENGVTQVPDDLKQAVCELVARQYKSRDWLGFRSKTLAQETITFDVSKMPPTVDMIVRQYKDTFIV